MRNSLLSIAAASMLIANVGAALAQENPVKPSWTTTQGETLTKTYRSMHYAPYSDPALNPQMGMVLPETVHVYPLPDSMNGPAYKNYSYGMVNDHPVVVETTTRRVVHAWN